MPSRWQFDDSGLVQGNVGNAPTYNDIFTRFAGQNYATGYDPALAMTLNAGGQGQLRSGIDAFLTANNNNDFQGANSVIEGGSKYNADELNDLAKRFGIAPGDNLEGRLQDRLAGYYAIGGLSGGWNPTGDDRQGNATLYESRDGKLVPIQTQGGHLREVGGYIQENPGILAPLGVAGAGLLAMYTGYGAGLGAGGAGGSGAGAAGAGYIGPGSAGAGAAGEGAASVGFGQSVANGLGLGEWYGGLGQLGQGAVNGAVRGGLTSLATGGNPLTGALTGGLSGGLSGGLESAGLPSWAASAGGRLASGLIGQGLAGGNSPAGGSDGGGGGGSSGSVGAGLLAGSAGPATGGLIGVGQANDLRQALFAKQLNTPGRAGDVQNDNALITALRQA